MTIIIQNKAFKLWVRLSNLMVHGANVLGTCGLLGYQDDDNNTGLK